MTDKFTTFAFTFRPRDGITDEQVSKLEKYVRKNCEYYHIITEKQHDERHVHCALVMKKPTTRSNVTVQLSRLYKDLEPDEKKVMVQGLKVWYNEDWLTKYLDKDDDTVVIASCLPEKGYLESYFPVKKTKEDKAVNRRLQWHSLMIELEGYWREYMPVHLEVNTMTVRDFLFELQYSKRVIGLMDDKKLLQVSKWFVRWWHKAERCVIELPVFEKEEGPGMH